MVRFCTGRGESTSRWSADVLPLRCRAASSPCLSRSLPRSLPSPRTSRMWRGISNMGSRPSPPSWESGGVPGGVGHIDVEPLITRVHAATRGMLCTTRPHCCFLVESAWSYSRASRCSLTHKPRQAVCFPACRPLQENLLPGVWAAAAQLCGGHRPGPANAWRLQSEAHDPCACNPGCDAHLQDPEARCGRLHAGCHCCFLPAHLESLLLRVCAAALLVTSLAI